MTQKKLRYLPAHRITDKDWLRKGILKELTIDAGDGRVSKITFKSYEHVQFEIDKALYAR